MGQAAVLDSFENDQGGLQPMVRNDIEEKDQLREEIKILHLLLLKHEKETEERLGNLFDRISDLESGL